MICKEATDLPILGAHNFSTKQFDDEALAVLNLGLKFVVAKKFKPAYRLEQELADFTRRVRLRSMFGDSKDKPSDFYVPNPAYQPGLADQMLRLYQGCEGRHKCSLCS
jgi:hypothetical protein